ncbi:Glycosyltransferase [Rhynchospora pubera]|uniref:Glycosyltransferase n=1 Tax=Rhynchospora pubera TaxID=906938 RepID=A0AAV8BZ01_9POAL|nr:Glycosyltransferase [Rhynchospora pubera]
MEKETIVLYPGMGAGHLAPMVLLAKRLVQHGFSVTIVTTAMPHQSGSTNSTRSDISSPDPSISFHTLPAVSVPVVKNKHPICLKYDTIREYNPKLLEFLSSLSAAVKIRAIVLDFFQTDAICLARVLEIPVYLFMTSGASILGVWLHLPVLHHTIEKSFKDMADEPVHVPGVPPIPASDMPVSVHDRESEMYQGRIRNYSQMTEADGIIVNTFEALEPRAVVALKDGRCVPDRRMPPVYCIGPLIAGIDKQKESQGSDKQKESQGRHECLAWLDSQPKRSVVYLCFGSAGAFSPEQIKEIAVGLESSGHRFLWVVCSRDDAKNIFKPRSEPDLNSLLPDGFLTRTKEQGMVVKSRAPQIEVLNHESIGGFVSHCGWNSALEAMLAGVPMICWPLYAEQAINKVLLVEELKVGMAMEGYDKELVHAEEVEAKVRYLMESEGGRTVRERMAAFREKAVKALVEGGSLDEELRSFVKDIRNARKR